MKLDGKVAIVTGAASGIGRAIAVRFASAGAAVVLADVNEPGAHEAAAAIGSQGGRAIAVAADVARAEDVAALVARTREAFGTLDVLVNNAGIGGLSKALHRRAEAATLHNMRGGERRSLGVTRDLGDAEWRRMIEVHLFGCFHCTRAVLPILEDKRDGSIVNMASVAGLQGVAGAPHYAAAKGGIIAFTKAIALEVAGSQVRVNAVAPGFIDTPMTAWQGPRRQFVLRQIPAGRIGTPDDVAGVALFLASDASRYVTGQVLSPNGGWYM